MVQIFKPNLAVIQQQAAEAKEYEDNRKRQSGDIIWGDLSEGTHILRVLPPTNSRGVIGKRVAKHYFNGTSFSSFQACQCPVLTHPDHPGTYCPIHDIGDKLLAQFPNLELNRWLRPGDADYVQCYDRQDAKCVDCSKVYRFTPALYNWFVMEMEGLMKQGIDPTDLQQGMDIKITVKKTMTRGKGGKQREKTTYEKTLWAIKGATPLHESPEVVQKILSSMKDLDKIWQYPDDAAIAEMNKMAADIYSYYMKQAYAAPGAGPNIPAFKGTGSPTVYAPPVAPAAAPQAMPVQMPTAAPVATQYAQPALQQPPMQAAPVPPAAVQVPVAPAPQPATTGPTTAPTDRPPCFGGAAPRSMHPGAKNASDDGGVGYSADSELCLICKYELHCMDACQKH